MTVVYYKSKQEWIKAKKTANAKGESTIHDDFVDKDGKSTDGKSGRLTFAVKPAGDQTKFLRKKQLTKKLKDDSITFDELKEYLRLMG